VALGRSADLSQGPVQLGRDGLDLVVGQELFSSLSAALLSVGGPAGATKRAGDMHQPPGG